MKKLILALIFALASVNVYAWADRECSETEIANGQNALKNITYNLDYADDFIDRNGDFVEGQFKITFPNLPDGYKVVIEHQYSSSLISNQTDYATASGGVYDVIYYSNNCDTQIKKHSFMVPYYKQYCDLHNDCEKDVWFDGTSQISQNGESNSKKSNFQTILIVILVTLILIITVSIIIFIKRKKKYEEMY